MLCGLYYREGKNRVRGGSLIGWFLGSKNRGIDVMISVSNFSRLELLQVSYSVVIIHGCMWADARPLGAHDKARLCELVVDQSRDIGDFRRIEVEVGTGDQNGSNQLLGGCR